MKRVVGLIFSALLFGMIAGGMMVGVNYLAQKSNIYAVLGENKDDTKKADEDTQKASPSALSKDKEKAASSGNSGARTGAKTVTEVAKDAMPSVVAITNMMRYQENGFSIFGEVQKETELPASGSGVIVGENETELLIATNNHVIQDSNSLTISFIDDSTATAQVKGTDVRETFRHFPGNQSED